jgi:hypothetical protein
VARTRKPYEFEEDPDPFVAVGLDAEWVYEARGRNLILSYQFALLNGDSGERAELIIYPKNGERISIEHGLTKVMLKARKERVITKVPKRFIIAGHFTRADLTTFSDFGLFKRRTDAVRKTYATTEIPLSLRLASNEGPRQCSAVILDTMLLAPAGTSLETLGKLLGMRKIDLPEGYSKDRMDLFLRDHPTWFEKYAVTDAVIPALWVVKTYGLLLDRLGIKKKVVTLGGAAVELVKGQAKAYGIELHEFLGRDKKKTQPLAHLMSTIAIAAQAYHGGYNLAAALGLSPEKKELADLDIRSAYTTALAFIGVPDWHSARHCIELNELAVIDEAMTAALVEFRFPDETRFPCLPVRASNNRGLVYPLEGASWCTGPELVVAIECGALVKVMDGYRVDWVQGSTRLFEDITRRVGKIRAEAKAMEPPDMVLDKLVKEIGNSIYGKIAQAVAATRIIKDDIERRHVFNTMFGVTDQMGPSAITNAPMAAYCTGLVRALLTETLTRLPDGIWVGTATTDGMLIAGGFTDIDQSGPVAAAFKVVRERITPGDATIWEVKHTIPGALVTKTRGTYTVAPEDWNGGHRNGEPGGAVLAKAGYMTPEAARGRPEIEQCRIWIGKYRERDFETRMVSKSLTSMRQQHLFEEDIQTVKRDVRWNADYDMKRKLVNVRDVDGLISADTVPWRSIDEFEQARDLLEDWKRSQRRVLKTKQDFDDMIAWGGMQANRRRTGTRSHNKLAPVAAAVLKIMAWRDTPLSDWFQTATHAQKAMWMSAICGVKVSETDVKNAKRRGAGPEELDGSITALTDDDRRFLVTWLGFSPIVPDTFDTVWRLCAPGSAAADELDELFEDARPEQEAGEGASAEPAMTDQVVI